MVRRPNKNSFYTKHSIGFRYVYGNADGGGILPAQQPKLARTQDVVDFQRAAAGSNTLNIPSVPEMGKKLDSPLARFIAPGRLEFIRQKLKKHIAPMYKKYFKNAPLPVGATDIELYAFYTINKTIFPNVPDDCYLYFKAQFKSGKTYIGLRHVVGGGHPVQ